MNLAETMTSPFRTDSVAGKVALITGGTSGIGLEIARQLGLHGAKVMVMGRREAVALAAAKELCDEGLQAAACVGDVRSPEQGKAAVDKTVETFGKMDILVNSAAGNFLATSNELSTNGFKTVMDIDTVGTFNMCNASFNALKDSKGLIMNITATLHLHATWWQIHACAAKAGVDAITRNLALEWGEYGIRVNGIAPGAIAKTAGMTKISTNEKTFDELIASAIPLAKAGEKWDIAMAAVFLASSGGRYITGDTIIVDGGHMLWKPAILPRSVVSKASRAVENKSRKVTGISKL